MAALLLGRMRLLDLRVHPTLSNGRLNSDGRRAVSALVQENAARRGARWGNQ